MGLWGRRDIKIQWLFILITHSDPPAPLPCFKKQTTTNKNKTTNKQKQNKKEVEEEEEKEKEEEEEEEEEEERNGDLSVHHFFNGVFWFSENAKPVELRDKSASTDDVTSDKRRERKKGRKGAQNVSKSLSL